MSVLDILRDLGGCTGGQLIYKAADSALEVRHPRRRRRRLRPETVARLQPLYPSVDLRDVDFVTSADLRVPNWFTDGVQAMTFGARMWFKQKRRHVETTDDGLELLMHELVHVAQYRARGSSKDAFACHYGQGYLAAGGKYAANPLEAEAIQFVKDHPLPPPRAARGLTDEPGGPATTANGPHRIDVLTRGAQKLDLVHRHLADDGWSNEINLGGDLAAGPAVTSGGPHELDVFVRGKHNDELVHRYLDRGQWSGWINLGGDLA